MSKEKFKDIWEEWSKLDKLGFVTYFILLGGFIIGLVYLTYLNEIIVNMLRLTYENTEKLNFWNFFAGLSMIIGFYVIAIKYQEIVDLIFYPETKEEKLTKKKIREFKKKYPINIAILKRKELLAEQRLEYLKEKIIEEKLK